MRFIEGIPRNQTALLPESLEDFVSSNHPVRVIDAFIHQLDFSARVVNIVGVNTLIAELA